PASSKPDPLAVSADIRNLGTADAGAFQTTLGLYADAGLTVRVASATPCQTATLSAGGEVTCQWLIMVPGSSQPATLYLGVNTDSANKVIESDEANNSRSATLQVSACAYAIAPVSINYEAQKVVISVITTSQCAWSFTSTSPDMTVPGSASGVGSGVVTLNVMANTSAAPRSLTGSVAGEGFVVVKQAAAPSLGHNVRQPDDPGKRGSDAQLRGSQRSRP